MSTKCTVAYGKIDGVEYHLYQECFTNEYFLQLEGDVRFDIQNCGLGGQSVDLSATLHIPKAVLLAITKAMAKESNEPDDEHALP